MIKELYPLASLVYSYLFQKFYFLLTLCIYLFSMDLSTNDSYFPQWNQLVGL